MLNLYIVSAADCAKATDDDVGKDEGTHGGKDNVPVAGDDERDDVEGGDVEGQGSVSYKQVQRFGLVVTFIRVLQDLSGLIALALIHFFGIDE